MFHSSPRFTCIAVTIVLVVGVAFAASAGQSSNDAEKAVIKAISSLASWKTGAARKALEKEKGKYGSTKEFKTAWALLEIQEGADDKKTSVANGTDTLTQMAKQYPTDPVPAYYLGEALNQKKDRPGAKTNWQAAANRAKKLIQADPTDASAYYYLGAANVRLLRHAEAQTALSTAARAGFDPAMVNYQFGLSLLFEQKWQDAKTAFDIGLAIEPRFAQMYYRRALAWDKLSREDNMLIDLDQFLKLAPNAPEAAKARAVVASSGG